MRLVLAVPAVLSLLACAGVFVEPEEGDYDVEVTNFEADAACADEVDESFFTRLGTMEVEINAASDEATFENGVQCQLTGAAFECTKRTEQDMSSADREFIYTSETTGLGRWTTSTTFESDWTLFLSCEGGDCDVSVDSCEIRYSMSGELD